MVASVFDIPGVFLAKGKQPLIVTHVVVFLFGKSRPFGNAQQTHSVLPVEVAAATHVVGNLPVGYALHIVAYFLFRRLCPKGRYGSEGKQAG